MAVFEYQGIDGAGKPATGIVDADNPRAARAKLKREGVFATVLNPATQDGTEAESKERFLSFRRGLSTSELSLLTRQIATLLEAGLPLVAVLGSLLEQTDSARVRRIFSQIRQKVNEGQSFHEALAEHPKVFADYYRNMVRAGEAGGTLPLVLARLADFLETSVALRRKVQAAMIYPILMAVLGTAVLVFLLSAVVPQLMGVFAGLGRELPIATRILLAMSDAVRGWWHVGLAAVTAIAILFTAWVRTPAGRHRFHLFLLGLPRVGTLLRITALARFTKTLGTLLNGGVKLLPALEIAAPVAGNAVLEEALEAVREDVRQGRGLREAMQATGQFPSEVRQMVGVGEQSGRLEDMLLRVAHNYEGRVEAAVASLTALLEPLMIIITAAAVGFMVLAILLPIFELTEALG